MTNEPAIMCPRCRGAVAVTSSDEKGNAVARCRGCQWIWRGRLDAAGQLQLEPAQQEPEQLAVEATSETTEARLRRLERERHELRALLTRWGRERRLLAMLAADKPQFDSPLLVAEARRIRDKILAPHSPPTENRQ